MQIVNLDEENIEEYSSYITPDDAENIGRTYFRGILVIDEETPVAGMIWEIRNMMKEAENEAHIIWLRVDHEDAADLLFEKYKEYIANDDVVSSDFCLPARTDSRETKILEDNGFEVNFMEGDLIKARLSDISQLPFIKKIKVSDSVKPLKTITQRGLNAGIRLFMSKGLYGLCEDLPYLSRSYFENDVSCYSEKDGQINGFLLFHNNPSGGLVVVVMAAIGSDYGKIIPQMMKQFIVRAEEIYSPDTEVWINRHNYASRALSEKLFPRSFGTPVYIGKRLEQ
jgi:hypothetical protein